MGRAADTEAVYNLYFILKALLYKLYHEYNCDVTPIAAAFANM
jgi:hypothetical protein